MLGIMDMVLVSSFIIYKMVHPDVCETGMARYDFMDSIAEALMSNDWGNFSSSVSGNTNDKLFEELVEQGTEPPSKAEWPTDPSELVLGKNVSCADCVHNTVTGLWEKRSKKKKFACQICRFEGRRENIVKDVGWCSKHAIRACSVAREHKALLKADGMPMTDYSWRPSDESLTCWNKAHTFYIPNGLFNDVRVAQHNPKEPMFQHVRLKSILYKKKRIAEGLDPKVKRVKQNRAAAVGIRNTSDGNSPTKRARRSSTRRLFAQSGRRVTRSAKMKTRSGKIVEVNQSGWV